jgi:hypothetical protein
MARQLCMFHYVCNYNFNDCPEGTLRKLAEQMFHYICVSISGNTIERDRIVMEYIFGYSPDYCGVSYDEKQVLSNPKLSSSVSHCMFLTSRKDDSL